MNKIADYLIKTKQLLCFEEAVRCGSVSAAAAQNNIKQPNISAQIKNLERAVQQQLMTRHSKGVSLTQSGYVYYAKACDLKNTLNDLENIDPVNNKISGNLRLWTTDGLASLYLAKCFSRFYERYPKINLEIKCTMEQPQLQDFDMALLFEKPKIKSLSIFQEHTLFFSLYASKSYLKAKGSPESISDLCKNHRICSNSSYLLLWPSWKHFCKKASHLTIIENSSSMLLTLIENGVGIGLVPDVVAAKNKDLAKLDGILPDLSLTFYITAPNNALKNPKIKALIDIINLETSR